ncbi:hypothetical protein V6N13_087763 [Hibiscus sabdariffa]|uniref:Uncharacterized protein n=1 Tax=Hibiscus sabdariffa TaxID=183260 RepID=A0ABR2FXU5_9ROSI
MGVFERLCHACDSSYRDVEVRLRDWGVSFGHTFHEPSTVADGLARLDMMRTCCGSSGRQFGGALAYGSWDVSIYFEIFRRML